MGMTLDAKKTVGCHPNADRLVAPLPESPKNGPRILHSILQNPSNIQWDCGRDLGTLLNLMIDHPLLKLLMWDIQWISPIFGQGLPLPQPSAASEFMDSLCHARHLGSKAATNQFVPPRASKGIQGTGGGELCPPWFNTDATRTGW